MTPKLTKEQAIIISGYTGFLICDFSDFHCDVERRLERPVWTHELGEPELWETLREAYSNDFINLAPE